MTSVPGDVSAAIFSGIIIMVWEGHWQKAHHNSCEEMKHSGIVVHTLENLQIEKA